MFKRRSNLPWLARLRAYVWPRKGASRGWSYLWHRLRRIRATPHSIALGLAIGVFMSFSPLIGFHILLAAIVCAILGANILAAAAGTMLCNPLTCPLMMIGNYQIGELLLREQGRPDFQFDVPDATLGQLLTHPVHVVGQLMEALGPVLLPMFLGSTLLGLAFALPFYVAARLAAASQQRRRMERLKARALAVRG
ncbi:MAG: DUF2062 domain-containing protein [Pseudomonadota bacterium]|nr:DUF2062 domain-containing protein [Pseudomonadota bacterium]